ncbi:dihydroxyacetone kinase subunit DhaK [Streptomyces sp. NPDC006422]|uniref:dihydroxyacetone kinase subunit DhaK n=1 Tax=Streptomyces sp. NPDC006422 TaxID=3155457 RepID=UPI0033A29F6E
MAPLTNDARRFAREAIGGFAAAHADLVRPVHGGVVRASATPPGQVAVVLGGGSGHYPAFAGWVGPGFAHGAACGEIFASPSAGQIASVARAAENGGGVLFGFGNYAGDVLHFGQAAQRLRAEGVDARVLTVTDDLASHPDPSQRRGIAGDLTVFKIMCAAAERGAGIDEVEEIGRRANAATRTLGYAFDGCTLPGAPRPLFSVAPGRMALGLGIHGEPGLDEAELTDADTIADRLLDGVLKEAPDGARRAAVLLNGLGATKYEELFVVYRRIAERLAAAGIEAVAPEVGEHVTSLDMAGLSLTLTFFEEDDELAELWRAPALAPAFRALTRYRAALDAGRAARDPYATGRAMESVGGAYQELGDWQRAADWYGRALAQRLTRGERSDAARLHGRIAGVHTYAGRYGEALRSLRSALAGYRKEGDVPAQARALSELARVLEYAGRPEESLHTCQEAVEWARRAGDVRLQAALQLRLADTLDRLGDPAAAKLHRGAAERMLGEELAAPEGAEAKPSEQAANTCEIRSASAED